VRLVVVAGSTQTAAIDGISAAGADGDALRHTPSADLEILDYGEPVRSPVVPVSPTGCPTPAVVTRAVREHLGFDVTAVDAGLARPTAAPTVDVGGEPGADIRDVDPVPNAENLFERARSLAAGLPDDEIAVAETIPGGTTTALGVLTALGERPAVSSSLPENPLPRKRRVVDAALAASDLKPGGAAGDPVRAVRRVGDPVLAVVAGVVVGATEAGTTVRLAGGTQLAAAAALARHAGVDASLSLETTSFVADDDSAAVHGLADDLDLTLRATDPCFTARDHPATNAYVAGEAKEGVGMGGALAMAARDDLPMATVRGTVVDLVDELLAARTAGQPDS
jgi:uncharacterized protein (TIGR00303 family)